MKIIKRSSLKIKFVFFLTLFVAGIVFNSFSQEPVSLSGSQACSFVIGTGSPNSGSYVVNAKKNEAFAFNDVENEQFVIEIRGDNFIDVMLIIEKPVLGKHTFTMEMQVSINISKNNGDDYFSFENHVEEGGGYIQIDQIDKVGGKVIGSFSGLFNDSARDDGKPVQIKGKFSVKRI